MGYSPARLYFVAHVGPGLGAQSVAATSLSHAPSLWGRFVISISLFPGSSCIFPAPAIGEFLLTGEFCLLTELYFRSLYE